MSLTASDWVALLLYALVWALFGSATEGHLFRRASLTVAMNHQRQRWIRTMARRELRMIDTSIMSGLQQGTAFFASSSLIAIGGCFALLGAPENMLLLLQELPFVPHASRELFELKAVGLVVLLAYSFFKFGWAYRLFNYCSVLIGAVPPVAESAADPTLSEKAVQRAAKMNILAAKHFSAGLRGVFFSVAYLGWFLGPAVFGLSTLVLLAVLTRRQFFSAARAAVIDGLDDQPSGEGRSVSVRPDSL